MNQVDKLDAVLKSNRASDTPEDFEKFKHHAVDLLGDIQQLSDDEKWLLVSHLLTRLIRG